MANEDAIIAYDGVAIVNDEFINAELSSWFVIKGEIFSVA